ncbi:MAG: hypothetical protein AB7G68_14045 [Nitrospiraceae bacterium]
MELVIWGLLIGMVGMIWILVAAALQGNDVQDLRKDAEDRPVMKQETTTSVQGAKRGMKAVA